MKSSLCFSQCATLSYERRARSSLKRKMTGARPASFRKFIFGVHDCTVGKAKLTSGEVEQQAVKPKVLEEQERAGSHDVLQASETVGTPAKSSAAQAGARSRAKQRDDDIELRR